MVCQQVNSYLKAHWVIVTFKRSQTWSVLFRWQPLLQWPACKNVWVCVCGGGWGDSWAYTVLQSNSLLSPMGQGQLNPGTSCFKCSFMRQMYLWKLIRHHNRFFMKMHYMGGRLVHVNPLPFPSPHPSTNPFQALAVLWVHKTSPY